MHSQKNMKKIVFTEDCPPRKKFRTQKKIHSLKNPTLRKIRCGFRSLLHLLYRKAVDNYLIEFSNVQKDKTLSYDQRRKKLREIREQEEELVSAHRTSPLGCGWCSERMDDLVFSPKHQNWFCVTCYEDAHRQYPDDYP